MDRLKGICVDRKVELGMKNAVDKIARSEEFYKKRVEIKEANKKNKILKYLRQKTIEKENDQRKKKATNEVSGDDSKHISGIDNANIETLEDNERRDQNVHNSLYQERRKFRYYYNVLSIFVQGLISLFAIFVFFYSLYVKEDSSPISQKDNLYIMEVIISFLILGDLLNSLILKKEKWKFFKSIINWTDFGTSVPIIITFMINRESTYYSNLFYNFWQVWRNLRFFRIYKIVQKIGNINDFKYLASISLANDKEIKFRFANIIFHILSFVILSASLMMTFQELAIEVFEIGITYETDFTFDAALYYVIITITTVGYGDMSPKTSFARIIICFFFIIAIIFITKQTSELSDLLNQNNLAYRMAVKGKGVKHVILTSSSLNLLKLFRFVREFFHKDHDIQESIKAVIICNTAPNYDMIQALSDFEDNIHFIVGSIFEKDTLVKADVAHAKAAFIISNQYDDSSMKCDTYALMATKVLRLHNRNLKINVQLVKKDNLIHSWCNWDNVYSLDEFKMGILAANAFNPGFCPFVLNLLSSFGKLQNASKNMLWLTEYAHGLEYEIYCIKIPNSYLTCPFAFLVRMGYFGNGSLIIGIRRRKPGCKFELYDIMINPINYEIRNDDEAIIIATDFNHAQRFEDKSNKTETQIEEIKLRNGLEFIRNYDYDVKSRRNRDNSNFRDNSNCIESEKIIEKFSDFLEETTMMRDHIIVFGPLESFSSLVECLRHFTYNYICYVSDIPKPEKWSHIESKYQNVKYIECVYSDKNELQRTGIEHARHVILLSWMLEKSNHPDSGILQIIQMIEQYYPNVPYTIELEDENNLKYMSKASEANKLPLNCNSKYAAGKVLYSSTLDSIIAQSYYNDTLLEVLDKLIFGDSDTNETKIEENSRLNMIRITEEIGGMATYENFFYTCTQMSQDSKNNNKPVIPIAIYRAPNKSILGNEAPYMITNPEKGTLLLTGDIVFVLGDVEHNIEKRNEELRKGVLKGDLSIGEGIKYQTMELTKEKLEQLDDDKILKIVQQELAGTEKERKRAKYKAKKEQAKQQRSPKDLEIVSEEDKEKFHETQKEIHKKASSYKRPKEERKETPRSVSSSERSFKDQQYSGDESSQTDGKKLDKFEADPEETKVAKNNAEVSSAAPSTVKQNYHMTKAVKECEQEPKIVAKEASPERHVEPSVSIHDENGASQAQEQAKRDGEFSREEESDEDDFIIKPSRKVF
ncbi:unnamed protein product [Moneuplotes crassus]|uniref:Uncharacterized protein n=1 Tax=Euplotes crassus TaxID=5936 RepID=A0AAD1USM8_EUPCR|nr:unnamed protein product [Moneuplotes crassus]